jgi:hypothetical protein
LWEAAAAGFKRNENAGKLKFGCEKISGWDFSRGIHPHYEFCIELRGQVHGVT